MLNREIIEKAILGNEDALREVIEQYLPYIRKCSMETVVHDDGRTARQVNGELEGEIISHLLGAIMRLEENNEVHTTKSK